MEDMSASFVKGYTLDRINNDDGYHRENCRWIPKSAQSANRRDSSEWKFSSSPILGNTTGYRGVSFDKSRGKYIATICVNRKQRTLGRFTTAEEARDAYSNAAEFLRGE